MNDTKRIIENQIILDKKLTAIIATMQVTEEHELPDIQKIIDAYGLVKR